jgi:hypothetical protein
MLYVANVVEDVPASVKACSPVETFASDITDPISKKQKVVKSIVRQSTKLSTLLPIFENFFIFKTP